MQHSLVGVEIMDMPSGRTLYSHNGNRRFVPASTAKVFTTACAFDTLGAGFAYKTRMLATGTISGDTLHGDLLIEPSQDPTFSRQDLRTLLSKLLEKKVTHIEGSVRILPVPGGYEQFLPGWLSEDWGQEWMPVCSNFVIDRNIAPGAQPMKGVKIVTEEAAGHNALHNSVLNSGISAGWLTYSPEFKTMRLFLSPGMSPLAPLVVGNPDEFNRQIVTSTLEDMGIHVKNHKVDSTEGGTLIAEHVSHTLPNIIETCLHESDNLYAQQLLRTIGEQQQSKATTPPSIEERGLSKLTAWLSQIGIQPQEVVLFDGCGLTRKNCVSPHGLCTVLRHMAGPNIDGPYLNLLKASGESGKGSFKFKTGAMDSVRSLAGVLQTAGGQHLSVAIMVNGHTPSVKGLRSSLTELIALLNSITAMVTTPPPAEAASAKPGAQAEPGTTFVEVSRQAHRPSAKHGRQSSQHHHSRHHRRH